jgi:hypothetical protein
MKIQAYLLGLLCCWMVAPALAGNVAPTRGLDAAEEDSDPRGDLPQDFSRPAVVRPAPPAGPSIVLPARLPATCVLSAAGDYRIPPVVMLAMIKVESGGKSVVGRNANGSLDLGVAQHNTDSWVPFFRDRYGIDPQSLLDNPCQSIRAQAYVLRKELDSRECAGVDIWCAVGRYHAPYNMASRAVYIPKVQTALAVMVKSGRFE